ncbi:hypothetical protein HDU98_002158 [Podochytrium sp. JEL0797]|nr:hypothetical protein HDU98_002158 [Podochytrium sp. JEL0797]
MRTSPSSAPCCDVSSLRISNDSNEAMKWLVTKDFSRYSTAVANEAKPCVVLPVDIKQSRYDRRVRRWKRDARSELDSRDWNKTNFARLNFHIPDHRDSVQRIDIDEVSNAEFVERFERDGLPCVISGVTREWEAESEWTPQRLLDRFHNEKFKVGEDDNGKSVHVPFSYFMKYCITSGDAARDDSPLYIFDPNFGDRSRTNTANDVTKKSKSKDLGAKSIAVTDSKPTERDSTDAEDGVEQPRKKIKRDVDNREDSAVAKSPTKEPAIKLTLKPPTSNPPNRTTSSPIDPPLPESHPTKDMMKDYSPPRYFLDDLFQFTGSKRPPHRWVVIGPKRSGTGIHQDPLGTSAWNTLVSGHKRWALFPPEIPKTMVTMRGLPDHEAATWFVMVYPRLCDRSTIDASGKTLAERLGMVEIIQRPGETVFVPGGWHHLVINLDFTVGVTQNFCSVANWEMVWLKTRHSRPKMGKRLLKALQGFVEHPRPGEEGERRRRVFGGLLERVKELEQVPQVPPSSSSSGSSSSSSSSSEGETVGGSRDSTESESSDEDGTCMCRKCKIRRKRKDEMIRDAMESRGAN